jgi:hypothetical protein
LLSASDRSRRLSDNCWQISGMLLATLRQGARSTTLVRVVLSIKGDIDAMAVLK